MTHPISLLASVGGFLLTGVTHFGLMGWSGSKSVTGDAHCECTKQGHMLRRHKSVCIACLVPIRHGKNFQILVLTEFI